MGWPTATRETDDGETVAFEYCCWTFCAWPGLMTLLRTTPRFKRCTNCQMRPGASGKQFPKQETK